MDDLALLISELVTNALEHVGSRYRDELRLEADLDPFSIRVRVYDGGGISERLLARDFELSWGFGLKIVDRIASAWAASRGLSGSSFQRESPTSAPDPELAVLARPSRPAVISSLAGAWEKQRRGMEHVHEVKDANDEYVVSAPKPHSDRGEFGIDPPRFVFTLYRHTRRGVRGGNHNP